MTESLADTIVPNSDQLNADDLIAGPLTVTVAAVKRGTKEQPIQIDVVGHRPYRPCKSMRRVLIALWGDQGSDWVGRSMRLYCDPGVKFGGVAVGGIRISHLSHIDGQKSLMLTTTRARRSEFIVQPLQDVPEDYPQADYEKNFPAWVAAIKEKKMDIPSLIQRVSKKGRLTAEQLNTIENAVREEDGSPESHPF